MAKESVATSRLATYRAKRDFAKTSEPARKKAVPSSAKLRFVIQRHDATRLHYDFRLELDGVLKSWAVTRGPSLDPHDKRLAVEVEDHPLAYGDFEGTIPKGQYGGGTVQLWDRGYWIPEGDPYEGLKRGELKFSLEGERLHGGWVLVRMQNDRRGGTRTNWLLIKHRDEAARAGDDDALLADPTSIASSRSLDTIAAGTGKAPTPSITRKPTGAGAVLVSKNVKQPAKSSATTAMPRFIEPQLCTLVARATSAPGWAHEVKFDGYRMQLRVEHGDAQLRTRKGLDWTAKFAGIAAAASALPDCLLDGEVVALDTHGAPDFAALQAALSDLCFPNNHTAAIPRSFRHRTSCRHPLVVIVHPTHFRESDDRALLWRLHRSGLGAVHGQRQMCAPPVIILDVGGQVAPKVALAENHHLIQALPPDTPDHPRRNRMLPGTPRGREHLFQAQVRHTPLKPRAIHSIPIAEKVLRDRGPGKGLDELLGGPLGGWMLGHIEVNHFPSVVGQHNQHEEDLDPDRGHGEEVEGHKLRHLGFEEDPPRGSGRSSRAPAILLDRGFRHRNSQLPSCAQDPWGPPPGIGRGDLPDQLPDGRGEYRPGPRWLRRAQWSRNRRRCQASTVAGCTNIKTSRYRAQPRASHDQRIRSLGRTCSRRVDR